MKIVISLNTNARSDQESNPGPLNLEATMLTTLLISRPAVK